MSNLLLKSVRYNRIFVSNRVNHNRVVTLYLVFWTKIYLQHFRAFTFLHKEISRSLRISFDEKKKRRLFFTSNNNIYAHFTERSIKELKDSLNYSNSWKVWLYYLYQFGVSTKYFVKSIKKVSKYLSPLKIGPMQKFWSIKRTRTLDYNYLPNKTIIFQFSEVSRKQ